MPGLTGPPPTPTALRLLRGNPGKRPLPKNEPKPPEVNPGKPAHIAKDKVASAEWDRLVALTTAKNARVLTVADGPMLEATVLAYSDLRESQRIIQAEGMTYETTNPAGSLMYRKRPEVEIGADAWRRYVVGLTHFGLSPATRTKVKATELESDEMETWKKNRGKAPRGEA